MAGQGLFGKLKKVISDLIDTAVKRPLLALIVVVVGLAAFAFSQVEMMHFTSSPKFCATCHPGTTTGPLSEAHTWEASAHAKAGVECLDCHGQPGAIGYMTAKMGGLVDTYGEIFKSKEHKLAILKEASDPAYAAKIVPNKTCLFCHSDDMNSDTRRSTPMSMGVHFRLLDSVHNPEFRKSKGLPDIIVEGVKPTTDVDPNHRKHIGAGLNCADCHLGIAHAGALHNKTKMATCFACHDKRRSSGMPANENCTGCHRKLDKVVPSAPIVFGAGEASVKFKHAPHVAAFKCTDCHTKLFQMAKGKAKIAYSDHATDKLCFSCHNGKIAFDTATCTKCHAKSPVPEAPIVFGSGDKAVKFSHKPHIAAFQCSECHENLFKMAKGSTKIVFTDHKSGKACFSCHSGKKAFGIDKCTKCHAKSPAPKKLVFKAKEMSSVTFNHEAHNAMFACNDCHTKIFNYKHPSPPVSMDDMGKGKACGACHNGKTAFATDGDCEKCHAK